MGIVRDLYYARKMSAGLKLPAPTVALLIKRLRLAAAMGGGIEKTVSGAMVHITDALAKAALSVLASIEPIQDLNGYDSPWPAGGGKNKFNTSFTDGTENGIDFTKQADGKILANGTLSSALDKVVGHVTLPAGTYILNGTPAGGSSSTYGLQVTDYPVVNDLGIEYGNGVTFTLSQETEVAVRVRFRTNNAQYSNILFAPMIRFSSESNADFAPYSNICPISGRTGLSVYVGPTQDQQDATTYAVDWTSEAGTVYGGTDEVVGGNLDSTYGMVDLGTLTWGFSTTADNVKCYYSNDISTLIKPVASHNDTPDMISSKYQAFAWNSRISVINGISLLASGQLRIIDSNYQSESALSDFTASLSGVQLCYELATPLTYQLSAQEVQMLLGENYVWSSSGDTVSVTYYAEGNANDLQSLNILLGGNYSNPKTADDVSDKEALEIILGGNK